MAGAERLVSVDELPRDERFWPSWHIVSRGAYTRSLGRLRGSQVRIFAVLPVVMADENWLDYSARDLADVLGLSAVTVRGGLRLMRKILVVGDLREGVRVNPHIFWKGPEVEWWGAMRDWNEEVGGEVCRRRGSGEGGG